jgi:hypothetical protein
VVDRRSGESERQIVVEVDVGGVVERRQDGTAMVGHGGGEPGGVAEQSLGGEQLGGDAPGGWVTDECGLCGEHGVTGDSEGLVEEGEHGELGSLGKREQRDGRLVE